ncbi:MAG: acyl-CoA dehydrogenase family protein, partial [Caldilineaceae bacterium]|nr:acyl-CoA dehydrogenase family protein [Caldilineaceae bacterium]
MAIEFKTPEKIQKSVSQAQLLAEFGMRPDSRALDEHEHERPQRFVQMIWPQMQAMEQANLRSALARAQHKNGELNGHASRNGANAGGASSAKEPRTANLELVHMIEMLSWGDAGIYLCIPGGGLGGAAINAVGAPEQLERFMRRFCEGEPKWGAMAMTEPQAGSDTSNIQTTARFDAETNEWVLNGQKIFCTNGKLALEESDGFVVVWATVDKQAGRAGMKSFVVEAHTPGVT